MDPQTHIGCSYAYDACEVGLGTIEEKRKRERSEDERSGEELKREDSRCEVGIVEGRMHDVIR